MVYVFSYQKYKFWSFLRRPWSGKILVTFCHLVYLRRFGIFQGICYILWSFGIFFTILVWCHQKNLATVVCAMHVGKPYVLPTTVSALRHKWRQSQAFNWNKINWCGFKWGRIVHEMNLIIFTYCTGSKFRNICLQALLQNPSNSLCENRIVHNFYIYIHLTLWWSWVKYNFVYKE
jgi:hypothetical protein